MSYKANPQTSGNELPSDSPPPRLVLLKEQTKDDKSGSMVVNAIAKYVDGETKKITPLIENLTLAVRNVADELPEFFMQEMLAIIVGKERSIDKPLANLRQAYQDFLNYLRQVGGNQTYRRVKPVGEFEGDKESLDPFEPHIDELTLIETSKKIAMKLHRWQDNNTCANCRFSPAQLASLPAAYVSLQMERHPSWEALEAVRKYAGSHADQALESTSEKPVLNAASAPVFVNLSGDRLDPVLVQGKVGSMLFCSGSPGVIILASTRHAKELPFGPV